MANPAAQYRVERAIRPSDQSATYLVVDAVTLIPHKEAKDYSLFLQGGGLAQNTQRAYIPRVCDFLNWCHDQGIDWANIGLRELVLYKRTTECMASPTTGKTPSPKTVNARMTAVLGFLRHCVLVGAAPASILNGLTRETFLYRLPKGMSPGENGRNRTIVSSTLKSKEPRRSPMPLTLQQVEHVLAQAATTRDAFLVILLSESGLRIGEALGLHRDDMHLLPESGSLGCGVQGAHIHVQRRVNENGAYAKSHTPRVVPVERSVVRSYNDYMHDRDQRIPNSLCPFLFVNLYWKHQPDTPMRYSNAKRCTDRLAKAAGVRLHPHALRHTAATEWVASDVKIDTVQELLGHSSPQSTAIYLHSTDAAKREAVERVSAHRARLRNGS